MITTRPYRILEDHNKVYSFLIRIYEHDNRNGQPAPFFEYAQSHCYYDPSQSHRNLIWEDDGVIVAMVYYEMKPGTALFALQPGYEFLVPDMVDYAEKRMRAKDGKLDLWVTGAQAAIREELVKRSYSCKASWTSAGYHYSKGQLEYSLPEGFRFLGHDEPYDYWKHRVCTWYGFNHGDEGEPDEDVEDLIHYTAAPHYRGDLGVMVVAPNGDYACYGGMWLVPENKLAYLEPLCTMPEYRRLGLAAAVLAELQRRTKTEGAEFMTGGSYPFYYSIGFEAAYTDEIWVKQNPPV